MADAPGSSGGGSHESGKQSPRSNVRDQDRDRFLPIANISRIMKKAVPDNCMISKDAKEMVQECVSELISFITSEASDKCQREKRKTVNGDDLLWAMATLGFENYIGPLKAYLNKYRELEGEIKGSARDQMDAVGVQPDPNFQIAYQGSFTHGMNYDTSQMEGFAMGGDTVDAVGVQHDPNLQLIDTRDAIGVQLDPNLQIAYQGSFTHGMNYDTSQMEGFAMGGDTVDAVGVQPDPNRQVIDTRDAVGVQPDPNLQIAYQGSTHGMNYDTSQSQAQHHMFPMQGPE